MKDLSPKMAAVMILVVGAIVLMSLNSAMAASVPKTDVELYASIGHSQRLDDGGENKNNSGYMRLRVLPKDWKTGISSVKVALGVFGSGQYGSGEAGTTTMNNYDWNKWAAGMTAKIYNDKFWNVKLDLGPTYQKGNSAFNSQTDYSLMLAGSYYIGQRGQAGHFWLPQTDVYFSVDKPFSSKKTSKSGADLKTDEKGSTNLILTQTLFFINGPVENSKFLPALVVGIGQCGVKQDLKSSATVGGQVTYNHKGTEYVVSAVEQFVDGRKDLRTTGSVTLYW